MHQVTVKDFPAINFGDIRRSERFVSIINNISSQPGSSIPKQNANWYDTKATYSFFKNEDITPAMLQQAIADYGFRQIGDCERILIAHDMSQISYNDLQAEGLGYLAHKEGRGIICYSSIAISEEGIPLSLLYQHNWTRHPEELGKTKNRKTNAFEDKESYHWYKGMQAVNEQLGDSIQKVHIADREADIYELFFCAYEAKTDLLIRAHQKRKLEDGSELWNTVAGLKAEAVIELQIPDQAGKKKISIEAEVRYHDVEILRPYFNSSQYESVEMTAIEVKQVSAQQSWQDEPVLWRLLTTLPVKTVAHSLQCVKWYCYRWLIERFHYVLKSGTRIEQLQLKQAGSLQKAIHVYSIAAMRIMQLVYQSRQTPNVTCEVVLTKEQWSILYMLIHKTHVLPGQPPTLCEAITWIGRLGGHLGRKSDGPPGLKTVWLGYQRICDAANIFEQLITLQNLGKD
jgi:hypothetical protein